VGNIGKEAPEIDVLPVEQPDPAEHESRSVRHQSGLAGREPRPAEPAPMPESERVCA
jgi:hypothetical protein